MRSGNPLAAGVMALMATAACAARVPHIDGMPGAPAAPDRVWIAPRAAHYTDPAAGAPSPSGLAVGGVLSLADAVELGLHNNPATRISWAQSRAAADAYGAARATFWPTLTGVYSATRSESPSGGFSLFAERTVYGPSASITWLLFDIGGRSGSVANARATAFAAAYTHNRAIQTTVVQVEQSYFGFVSARALRDAQLASVQEAQASYDATRAMGSVGLATIADELQARTALAQARLALQTAEGQLQIARGALAFALGVSPTTRFDIAARPEDVPVGVVMASVDTLITVALRERPDLQAAYATVAASRASVRTARAAALPSLSFSGTEATNRSSVSTLSGRSFAFGLSLALPLFDGGGWQYGIARAQALADVSAAQAATQRLTVMDDVYTAFYSLETAAEQVRTGDELFVSATESLRAARALYTNGLGTILSLITAQAALATARATQVQARWIWAQSLAQLAYASGSLGADGRVALPLVPAAPPTPP